MKIIAVTDYKEKVFLGIEQANIIKKRIKENNAWENDYLLGVLWIDNCRYIQRFLESCAQVFLSSIAQEPAKPQGACCNWLELYNTLSKTRLYQNQAVF